SVDAAAELAPVVAARRELRRTLAADLEARLRHGVLAPARSDVGDVVSADVETAEREAHEPQQLARLVVGLARRADDDVHAVEELDLVRLDLGEHDLLGQAERVVPAPVERLRREAAEVADTGHRDRRQTIEELVHPLASQRDLA